MPNSAAHGTRTNRIPLRLVEPELPAPHLHAVPQIPGPPRSSTRRLRALPTARAAPVRPLLGTATAPDLAPPPTSALRRLALCAFEAVEGSRALSQLGDWLTPEAIHRMREHRTARVELRTVTRDQRRVMATPGPVHLSQPLPHLVEATVIMHASPRACAVALRLEHLGGRWRGTDLTVM